MKINRTYLTLTTMLMLIGCASPQQQSCASKPIKQRLQDGNSSLSIVATPYAKSTKGDMLSVVVRLNSTGKVAEKVQFNLMTTTPKKQEKDISLSKIAISPNSEGTFTYTASADASQQGCWLAGKSVIVTWRNKNSTPMTF